VFSPINDFRNKIDYNTIGIDSVLVNNIKSYSEKYYFEPYESIFLKELNIKSNSNLYVSFSNPIENYLITEIRIDNNDILNGTTDLKRGPTLEVLFIFNEEGLVEKVYTASTYYN
jgi:hypothetical protein